MADFSIDIDSVQNISPVTLNPVQLDPFTIQRVQNIAPVAVHIKEVNQIDPLTVESLRVDGVRSVEPLRVDRLNITNVPTVNLALDQLPSLSIDVRRVPSLAIGLHQQFDLPSRYTAHVRLLGFEVMRLQVHGCTQVQPRDCAPRANA